MERALEWIPRFMEAARERREEWVTLVERLARLESPSTDAGSQRAVQDLLAGSLDELGYRVRRIPGVRTGGHLLGLPPGRPRRSFQLLLGHSDTVWPVGTLESMPVRRDGSRLYGPGVFDMKGGLAGLVVALRILRDAGVTPGVAPVVFVNSDEEIGSPESTRHVIRLARRSCRALVFEPALGPEGRLKTARKGTGRFSIRILGRSAHAGLDPEKGVSAIQELTFLVQELHGMTDPERGIVVTVGQVRGGLRPNVIAAEAVAEVDVRVTSMEDGRRIQERIHALEARVPGCRLEIRGTIDRPPLERTPGVRRLWEAGRELAGRVGIPLEEGSAGGASDGNTTGPIVPTLDGLGAVGDGAHAKHEHLEIDRSLERCALLAGLLLLPGDLE